MGLYYKTEFVWGRDDDGNHRKRRVTSGSGTEEGLMEEVGAKIC